MNNIHKTSIVDKKAHIGENVTIGPYSIIASSGNTSNIFKFMGLSSLYINSFIVNSALENLLNNKIDIQKKMKIGYFSIIDL